MAARIEPSERRPVQGPPDDWKRPAIPRRVLAELLIRQEGKDPDTGARLEPLTRGIEVDHVPSLRLRQWDPVAQDTIPPANSIDHMVVRDKPEHRTKTSGRGHTSYGSDIHAIAKLKRLEGRTGKGKKKRKIASGQKIPSRPFPKVRRSFR